MVGLCRLCASLRKINLLVTINDDTNELCEKVRKCFSLNIEMCDALPKSICQECIENLNKSYKFYTKVKDAQETLQALYPPPSDGKETNVVQTLSEFRGKPKQIVYVVKNAEGKHSKECIKTPEIDLKQVKLENYLLGQTKDIVNKYEADKKNTTDTRLTKECVIEEVYNNSDTSKEHTICGTSYELLQTVEENIDLEDNYLNYQNVGKQKEDFIELQYDKVIQQINEIIPDNELNVEVEYMEYCEDEDEGDDIVTNITVEQSANDNDQSKHISSQPTLLKISSWKNYTYLCFICDGIFLNFVELKSHIAQVHGTTKGDLQYKCYDCKKIIPRYNFFLNHVRFKHHPDLKLKCDVCDLSCQNFEDLSHHRSVNCAEALNYADTVPCNQCFKTFHSESGLQNHCKSQHTSESKVKYTCTQCNKEFQNKGCLRAHEQKHTDIKKFTCSFCDRSFYNKVGLDQHLYVHVNEKTYQCNICNKSYKTFRILNEHQKLHTNEKPFKCQFCDKSFSQKVQKVTHERSHTANMPYSCKQCEKLFRYRSALNAHSKIHTGDKPFACEYCVKTFADSSNRNKHVRRIHSNGKRKENIQ